MSCCDFEKHCMPHHHKEICPALGFQEVQVCVPVEVRPFAEVGRVKTECCGKPVIHRGSFHCESRSKECCKFTISQKIRIEVPVVFGAKTEVGEAHIDCEHKRHCHDFEKFECERKERHPGGCEGLKLL